MVLDNISALSIFGSGVVPNSDSVISIGRRGVRTHFVFKTCYFACIARRLHWDGNVVLTKFRHCITGKRNLSLDWWKNGPLVDILIKSDKQISLYFWLTDQLTHAYCCGKDSSVKSILQWRHNERNGVSNHRRPDCLLNRLFRRRSKKTSKLSVTGLCWGEFPGDRWIQRTKGQ